MYGESRINRRQFLTNVSVVGVFTLFPFFQKKPVAHEDPDLRSLYRNALITVLKEQALCRNSVLSREEIRNLDYAYDKIRPTNHQEMAFVVACSMSEESRHDVVDEYVRRREGKESLLPDHPLMALETWAMPDTKRILIFKEQMEAFMQEMTLSEHFITFYSLLRYTFPREDLKDRFVSQLVDEQRNRLTNEEITIIYEALEYYYPKLRPYYWCSTIVTRANALVSKSIGSIYDCMQ